MYILKDNGVLHEIECGSNFGYILSNNADFVNTDYKVLLSQTSGIFLPCMKMLYNGKIELYYVTEEHRLMSTMFSGITPDTFVNIAVNIFANVIEVKNNGFLSCQNIDLAWDKIYVDINTLKVKLVYLPVTEKTFENYMEFESELRSSLVKLINKVITSSNARMNQFVLDLCNGSLSLEDVYNRSRGVGAKPINHSLLEQGGNNTDVVNGYIKMVAMNAPEYFEIIIDRDEMVIGKKPEIVDAVVPYNKMISRKHCRIIRNGNLYFIKDEGSANGTYVNRIRVSENQPYQIKRGDFIRLADSDFQIV